MKLIQCCVDPQNTMQNECCESCPSFEMWQNASVIYGSEPRGLVIYYMGNDCSDGFWYNKTVFNGIDIGPSCSDYQNGFQNYCCCIPVNVYGYDTDYTSWTWGNDSGVVQILVDKAKNDGLIGSSTTIELYADKTPNTVLYDPELMDEYGEVVGGTRLIEIGEPVQLAFSVSYRVAPCVIVSRLYQTSEFAYQGNTCAETHIANVTWYDTEQPDGTYWRIEGVGVTISEYL